MREELVLYTHYTKLTLCFVRGMVRAASAFPLSSPAILRMGLRPHSADAERAPRSFWKGEG